MTASDIIAIVGAAAWAPQIFQWISDALKKPAQTTESVDEVLRSKTTSKRNGSLLKACFGEKVLIYWKSECRARI